MSNLHFVAFLTFFFSFLFFSFLESRLVSRSSPTADFFSTGKQRDRLASDLAEFHAHARSGVIRGGKTPLGSANRANSLLVSGALLDPCPGDYREIAAEEGGR